MSKMAVKLGGQNSSSGGSPCHEEIAPLPLRAGAAGGRAGGPAARSTMPGDSGGGADGATPVISAALPQGLRADGRSGIPGMVQHQGRRITGSSRYHWVLRVCRELIDENLTTTPHPHNETESSKEAATSAVQSRRQLRHTLSHSGLRRCSRPVVSPGNAMELGAQQGTQQGLNLP